MLWKKNSGRKYSDGDFSYVTPGDDHSLVSDAGKLTYYIWYERRVYTEQ